MTGIDLKGQASANPGFFMMSSANSAANEGRSIITPAFMHRNDCPEVVDLQNYKTQDVDKIINHWSGEATSPSVQKAKSDLAQGFCALVGDKEGALINLRDLRNNLAEALSLYEDIDLQRDQVSAKEAELQAVLHPLTMLENARAQRLRPIYKANDPDQITITF